jgi:DNA mismatch endonuclease, patch repair protein
MRAIHSKDTAPEWVVRRLIHGLGYRFRLHRKDLPGHPDLVLPRLNKVVFVHGCFWHGHSCARGARIPMTNRAYWVAKIARNEQRDRAARLALGSLGWSVAVVWECKTRDQVSLERWLVRFLVAN